MILLLTNKFKYNLFRQSTMMNKFKAGIMKKKFEVITNVPTELTGVQSPNLGCLPHSKYEFTLFKSIQNTQRVLQQVTLGNLGEVKIILNEDRSLLSKKSLVSDCSGPEFVPCLSK